MEDFFVTESQHELRQGAPSETEEHIRPLAGADPMIVLAHATLRSRCDAWCAYQPAAGQLPSAEAIHQMRISTRRLRVLLRVFEQLLPSGIRARLGGELRWFGHALGEVRDLDVYAENLTEYARTAGLEPHSLAQFELTLNRARDSARANLEAMFAGERCRSLASALETLRAGPSAAALRRWRSFRIDDGAAKYLEATRRHIVKRGRRLDAGDPPERLHSLRIMVKRFRYEVEVFTGVYPRLQKIASAGKELQDALGEFQDACTAIERLQGLLKHGGFEAVGGEPQALAQLVLGQRARADSVRRQIPDVWQSFERAARRTSIANALATQ